MEENISYTMENSDSDSEIEVDQFYKNYMIRELKNVRPKTRILSIHSNILTTYYKELHEKHYGKEIWKMLEIPLYQDMDELIRDICDDKWYSFVARLFDNNMGKDYNFRVLGNYVDNNRRLNRLDTLIFDLNGGTPMITTYVKLLLTYDKYNKLHALKNKTKLNNDIIFNLIIKYL